MNYYYFAAWDKNDEGPADMWWYSSEKNMKLFTEFYDFANNQLSLGSEYISKFEKPNFKIIHAEKKYMVKKKRFKD
jgi:hypothetical protein